MDASSGGESLNPDAVVVVVDGGEEFSYPPAVAVVVDDVDVDVGDVWTPSVELYARVCWGRE